MTYTIKGDPAELFRELSDMAWDAAIAGTDGQDVNSVEAFMDMFDRRLSEVLGLKPSADDGEQPDDNS